METQLKNLEDELRLKNFSKKTIKSYIFETEKFLKFSQNKKSIGLKPEVFFKPQIWKNRPKGRGIKPNLSNKSLIQKPLGHSDIKTTQIYLKISNVSIKNIKSSLDNL